MRQFQALFQRELAAFFYSPMSYVVWVVFLIASGYLFAISIRDGGQASLYSSFTDIAFLFVFIAPMITMRLIAEEAKLGSLEILLSEPTHEVLIITAKYAAALVFLMVLITPTVAYAFILSAVGSPDVGPIISGYFGLFLFGSLFIAIGILFSSMTNHQIAAAAASFTLLLLLWAISRAADAIAPGTLRNVLSYVSAFSRFSDFRRGIVDSRSMVYFVSSTLLFLFLATRVLGLRRLR